MTEQNPAQPGAPSGPPAGHVQQPGTHWTPSDPQQLDAPVPAPPKKETAKEALQRVVSKAVAGGSPVITEQPTVEAKKARAKTTPTVFGGGLGKDRESFYATIVVTAVEGGINHWATVERYAWWAHDLEGGLAKPAPDGGDNAAAFLWEGYGEENPKKHYLDLHSIDHAYVLIEAGQVKGLPERDRARYIDIRNRMLRAKDPETDAAGELDANDCDNIVQIALLDEVVYG